MDWRYGSWGGTPRVLALGAGLVVAGCSEPPREEEAAQQPTGNEAATGSLSSTTSSTSPPDTSGSVGADSSTGDDGGIKLDVGPIETTGVTTTDPDGEIGCKKVDFLFVIDNSGSMGDEQDNLIASFPGFISTIEETLDEAQDYHLMVVDTDEWVYGGCGALCAAAPAECYEPDGTCNPFASLACGFGCLLVNETCEGYDCLNGSTPLVCEAVLGAGVVHPRGTRASNQDCNFANGLRYMDSAEPDLPATFACAANVGVGSTQGTERPMESMVQAVTAGTAALACNAGFLRDDAILVVTFVTDEDDNNDSSGNVDEWRQALVTAKGGDESAVVVLGLYGDNDQPGAVCPPLDPESTVGAEPSVNLRGFVDSWGARGISGSVCAK
ncbi:MAG: hypothetical protein KUG77_03745, partial [Nannocystaceae bacterium]|nr:hypothetical protein [Nannocystaceae bacterium]